MPVFPEKLKNILNLKSSNAIEKFADDSGIPYVLLCDILSGKREPNEDEYGKIINMPGLPQEVRAELEVKALESYLGEDGFKKLKNIRRFFIGLSNDSLCGYSNAENASKVTEIEKVKRMIEAAFIDEIEQNGIHGYIRIIADPAVELLEMIMKAVQLDSCPVIEHLICFYRDGSNEEHKFNLSFLSNIVKVCENTSKYKVLFSESTLTYRQRSMKIFPFFIVTSRKLVTVSSDFSMAYMTESCNAVDIYAAAYEKRKTDAAVLTEYSDVPYFCSTEKHFCAFNSSVEIMPFLKREQIREIFAENADENVLKKLVNAWDFYNNAASVKHLFLYSAGIDSFFETGIAVHYGSLMKPLSVEQRCEILREIRTALTIERNSPKKFVIRENKLAFPDNCSMYFVNGQAAKIGFACESIRKQLLINRTQEFDCIFGDSANLLKIKRVLFTTDELIKHIGELLERGGE